MAVLWLCYLLSKSDDFEPVAFDLICGGLKILLGSCLTSTITSEVTTLHLLALTY
jgi:hypothetical protein